MNTKTKLQRVILDFGIYSSIGTAIHNIDEEALIFGRNFAVYRLNRPEWGFTHVLLYKHKSKKCYDNAPYHVIDLPTWEVGCNLWGCMIRVPKSLKTKLFLMGFLINKSPDQV